MFHEHRKKGGTMPAKRKYSRTPSLRRKWVARWGAARRVLDDMEWCGLTVQAEHTGRGHTKIVLAGLDGSQKEIALPWASHPKMGVHNLLAVIYAPRDQQEMAMRAAGIRCPESSPTVEPLLGSVREAIIVLSGKDRAARWQAGVEGGFSVENGDSVSCL